MIAQKSILVADDRECIRGMLRRLLSARNDWRICAEAEDGIEAVKKAKALAPDIAILDISMPRMDGFEAARQISFACQSTAVLSISLYDPRNMIDKLIMSGVRGFVAKMSMYSNLIPAIDALLSGKTYFDIEESLEEPPPLFI
ncbi:MAG TPA: response regulator transcription factor [Candidatus Dormibacteraeota bacterium]|nr:response regulator transcription factor [Candidatus Dormibacteraeota bacterium]